MNNKKLENDSKNNFMNCLMIKFSNKLKFIYHTDKYMRI